MPSAVLSAVLIIGRKELVDHARDTRSLLATALYTLMGPLVVALVAFARPTDSRSGEALVTMASVFAMVAAFTGGMGVAMDTIAGERERESLLPLLLNSVSRAEIIIGKWLAASAFAACGVALNVLVFAAVFAAAPGPLRGPGSSALVAAVAAVLPLALLAAGLEILVSVMCRNLKEANTYLSLLVFVVMGSGMWLAFRPYSAAIWWFVLPIGGQQRLLQGALGGAEWPPLALPVLALTTAAAAAIALARAAKSFERDDRVLGG